EPAGTGVAHSGITPYVVQSGDVGLKFLSVAAGARAVVQGPCNLVVEDLTISSGGTLEFDTDGGAVAVWVADDLNFVDGSTVQCSGTDPSQSVGSNAQMLGAVVADQLVLSSGAKLTFDSHLDEVNSATVLPKLLSWRILELESAMSHGEGSDPFEILGVDPTTLLSPALAHADIQLHVVYKNLLGATQTYDGMENGFDWTKVSAVTQVDRAGKPVGYRATGIEALAAQAVAKASATVTALTVMPPLSSAELKRQLMFESPLPANDLIRIVQSGRLQSSDLKTVLQANAPLSSPVLSQLSGSGLPSSDLKAVLIASSPLPVDALANVLSGLLSLSLVDKLAVIAAQ
ncbi:MAG: hypothetical protein K8S98_15970, partial [Planctomycetes bacterium]|nr:hypothetical protein [Planctomycetota bacterium]